MKDYYKILEVSPSATYADIKKSYRRLALQYHPDKNFGNQLYEARFKEIKEAYEILSDNDKRNNYNYSRESYPKQSAQRPSSAVNPQVILKQAIELRKKISVLDPDRMNKLAAFQQIEVLLSPASIRVLQHAGQQELNKKIIEEIMYCSRFLPFTHVEKICFQLTSIAGTDNELYNRIYSFSKKARVKQYWTRYQLLAALIIASVLCFLIYMLSTIF